jgi:hypothetical protein
MVNEVDRHRNRAGRHVMRILYNILGDTKSKTINAESKRVDYSPVPLGFTNFSEGNSHECVVLSRVPARVWKVGLSTNNLHIQPCAGKRAAGIGVDIITAPSIRKTIRNEYPSYKAALRRVETGDVYSTVAFCRHFAVQKRKRTTVLIYYKYREAVGYCDENKAKPRLKKIFAFLQEHLDEVL